MKISISGTAASGKSTIAKKVAEKLGFKHFSMGDFQREIAREKGVTISELGKIEADDKSIDEMVDNKQIEIGKREKEFVIDSRLGTYFIPDSIKIFVDAALETRAQRRFLQKQSEESFKSKSDAMRDILKREEINRKRFIKYYGFDFFDMHHYDLIIDTTNLTIEDAAEKIIEHALASRNN